jgi:hypothetical protein
MTKESKSGMKERIEWAAKSRATRPDWLKGKDLVDVIFDVAPKDSPLPGLIAHGEGRCEPGCFYCTDEFKAL